MTETTLHPRQPNSLRCPQGRPTNLFLSYDEHKDLGLFQFARNQFVKRPTLRVVNQYPSNTVHMVQEINEAKHTMDLMAVLVGKHTHVSKCIEEQVQLANKLDIPVIQIGGFSNTWCSGRPEYGVYFDWRRYGMTTCLSSR